MKQINLSKLKVELAIGEFRTVDVRKELGNVLFAKATTLEQDELSRKDIQLDGRRHHAVG